jgi:hypothetical protein
LENRIIVVLVPEIGDVLPMTVPIGFIGIGAITGGMASFMPRTEF